MKTLFDTNVILDVLLNRKPHADIAANLLSKVERGEIQGLLCATTITTLYYLLQKTHTPNKANLHIQHLLQLFDIAPVNRAVVASALEIDFSDYEDAVLHQAALYFDADNIVTRNIKDFKRATLPCYEPAELLTVLNTTTQ